LIPTIVDDGILNQIVNLMMQQNRQVFEAAHKLFCTATVTENSAIINHMVEIDSLKVMTEFLNCAREEIIKQTLFGLSNIAADNEFSAANVL
jgi:hypothetical protein